MDIKEIRMRCLELAVNQTRQNNLKGDPIKKPLEISEKFEQYVNGPSKTSQGDQKQKPLTRP